MGGGYIFLDEFLNGTMLSEIVGEVQMKILHNRRAMIIPVAAAAAFLALIGSGCTKMPDTLMSPAAKIDIETQGDREVFIFKMNAGLRNENGDTALLNVKGTVRLLDAGNASKILAEMPFEAPVILPYETAIIDVEKEFTENEIRPVANLLGGGIDEIIKNRGVDNAPLDEKSVKLDIKSYDRRDIVKLLQERAGAISAKKDEAEKGDATDANK